ncbi:MAG: hypothetical protein IJ623_10180 [Bacteroidales bacterium]|nr:hypothetical protein [Bacteroidales bacterium]
MTNNPPLVILSVPLAILSVPFVILSEAKNLCYYMDFVYICTNNIIA